MEPLNFEVQQLIAKEHAELLRRTMTAGGRPAHTPRAPRRVVGHWLIALGRRLAAEGTAISVGAPSTTR